MKIHHKKIVYQKMTLARLVFSALIPSLVVANMPLHPVIFLPGFSGSLLFARVEESRYLPTACIGIVPVNQTIEVIYNSTLGNMYYPCVKALLEISFDETKGFSPTKGIDITVTDFGGTSGITPSYASFFTNLTSWGYVVGETLFGAPYDYRYATSVNLERSGLIPDLKALVETAYSRDNMKVYLMAHSNGGPTVYTFLSAMSEEWKRKYVAGYIPLSGNFLGQLNAYSSFFHDELYYYDPDCTWESTYTSASFGGYTALQNVTFLKTYTGTAQEQSYTARLKDMTALFDSIQHQDWSARLRYLYSHMNMSVAPTVNMHCLYGQAIKTDYAYEFVGSIDGPGPNRTLQMDGDGNQDIFDNQFCLGWANQYAESVYSFEAVGFSGVSHTAMCYNPQVMDKVHSILFADVYNE